MARTMTQTTMMKLSAKKENRQNVGTVSKKPKPTKKQKIERQKSKKDSANSKQGLAIPSQ